MIRHRPYGSGHPYAATEDQRVPAEPVHGEPVELRVRAAAKVTSITCEWAADDTTPLPLPLLPLNPPAPESAPTDDGGHLAAAQARAARAASGSWSATTPPLQTGHRYTYRFRATADDGTTRTTRWYEVTAATWQPEGGHLTVEGPLTPTNIEWLSDQHTTRKVRFDLPLQHGDHVVGFGERYDAVDQRGRRLDAVVFEQYKAQGEHGRTYLPMPFALVIGNDQPWGLHLETTRRTWFDVGDHLRIEAEVGPDAKLTLRLFSGTPTDILRTFLDDAGRPTELPSWVFKLWASGNEWNTQQRVMAEMDQHRAHDIPVGAVVIEAWSDESTFTAFRGAQYTPSENPHAYADYAFPPDGPWPDPKGMVDDLHQRDIRVLLWQIPLQKMRPHPEHQAKLDAGQLLQNGYGIHESNGKPYRNRGWWFPLALMPDLSSPEVRAWWTAKRRYLVDELGIDGFKTDGGEHAWGHDLRYADGRRGADGNSLFPVHYARAFGDLLRAAGKPPVTFSRAGFTGSQPHGAFWAGDEDSTWAGYRSAIRAGITASACGIVYWGWDLAGFSGDIPSAELYLRAAGASTFMPIMQYHSEFNHHRTPKRDRTPWNIAEQTNDDQVIPIFRKLAHLRERLIPYLTQQAHQAINGGPPLMRGLFFDHPDDPHIWNWPLQYKLGDALLVIPVTDPGKSDISAYLPEGHWIDCWTGTTHHGPQQVTLPAPLDRPPVLCAAPLWPTLAPIFT